MQNYNNDKYRWKPKIITGVPGIGEIPGISEIKPIAEIQPIRKITTWSELHDAYDSAKQSPQEQHFLANYNDPEELNSYLDALVNRKAVSKDFGEAWGTISTISGTVAVISFVAAAALAAAAFFTGGATAAGAGAAAKTGISAALQTAAGVATKVGIGASVPAIPAAAKVTYDYGVKPIVHGKPEQALLNTMINLGETMDFAANPVKGLVMEGPQGFLKATGLTNEGRVNYDYDTGFIVTDMLLEILSDPMTWIEGPANIVKSGVPILSFFKPNVGGKVSALAVKNATRLIGDNATKNFSRILGKEVTEKNIKNIWMKLYRAFRRIIHSDADILAKGTTENQNILVQIFKKQALDGDELEALLLSNQIQIQQAFRAALRKEFPDITASQIELLLKNPGRNAKGQFLSKSKAIGNLIKNTTLDDVSSTIIHNLTKIQNTTNTIQSLMMKAALLSSGNGFGIFAAKKTLVPLFKKLFNRHPKALSELGLLHENFGLTDLGKYEALKNMWDSSVIYHTRFVQLGLSKAVDPLDSFYTYMTNQFAEDQRLIRTAIQDHATKPIEQAAALDAIFNEKYGIDFKGYIEYLRTINASENNMYKQFVNYAEQTHDVLHKQGATIGIAQPIQTSAQVYATHKLDDIVKQQETILNQLTKLRKAKTPNEIVENLYTLKLNDYTVNAALINDPRIYKTMSQLTATEGIGALLTNIAQDPAALAPEANAKIAQAVRSLRQAGVTYFNMRDLYDDVAALILPELGIDSKKFKQYLIDQIFGMKGTVSELLASFENTTIPELIHKLETFLYEYNFKVSNYVTLRDQISGVFKKYLEAQHIAGIETLNVAIAQDFISSIENLVDSLPIFNKELSELVDTSVVIKTVLGQVRDQNLVLLEQFFTNKNTIFEIFNTRQLADAGLALKTVATEKNIALFNIPENVSGNLLIVMENLGKRLNNFKQRALQLGEDILLPNKYVRGILAGFYTRITESFAEQTGSTLFNAFKYLKPANDIVETVAQLAELYKVINTDEYLLKTWNNIWQQVVKDTTSDLAAQAYRFITNPERLLVTDYAWDAMRQAAFYAEKELNEHMLNVIGAYDGLNLSSKKIIKDMQQMRELYAANKADRAKMIQLERYAKAAKRVTETIDWFKTEYNKLFDHKRAKQIIEDLRNIFVMYPEHAEKYVPIIDELEAYWNGTKTFEQAPKYMRNTDEFVDDFTPFWDRVKNLQDMCTSIVAKHNDTVYKSFRSSLKKLDNEVLNSRRVKFDKAEWNKRYIKFDKEYFNSIRVKWDDEYWDFLKSKFDPEELKRRSKLFDKDHYNSIRQHFDKEYFEFLKEKVPVEALEERFGESIFSKKFFEKHIRMPFDKKELRSRLYVFDKAELAARRAANPGIDANEIYKAYIEELNAQNQTIYKNYIDELNEQNAERFQYLTDLRTKRKQQLHEIEWENRQIYNAYVAELKKQNQAIYTTYTKELEEFNNEVFQEYVKELKWENHQIAKAYAADIKKQNDILFKEYTDQLNADNEILFQEYLDEIAAQNDKIYKEYIEEIRTHNQKAYEIYQNNKLNHVTVTPWEPIRRMQDINKKIKHATDQNAYAALYNVFNYTPEQLKQELAFRKRFITFTEADLNIGSLKHLWNQLKSKLGTDTGVQMFYDTARQRYWLILDKNQKLKIYGRDVHLNGQALIRNTPKKNFNEFQIVDETLGATEHNITDMLNNLSDDLEELTGSALGDSQGEFFSRRTMEQLFELNEYGVPKHMPREVWEAFGGKVTKKGKYMINLQEVVPNEFFDAYAFNESILGSAASKAKLAMVSDNMIVNAQNSIAQAQCYIKAKTEYVHTIFGSVFDINNLYKNFSDVDLLNALQSMPDYKIVALVTDKKYGVRVQEILPLSVKDIQTAKELHAVIVPLQVYKDMYTMVNHRLGSAGLMQIWNRIMYVFKFGYLMWPGTWIKNWIDTNFKTNVELGSEAYAYRAQARRLLDEYDKINEYIARRAKDGMITTEALTEFFETNPNSILNLQAYRELEESWFSQAVSGGIAHEVVGNDAWSTMTHYMGKALDMFSGKTEAINRLAIYLADIEQGLDLTSALTHVAKTHFDYSFKTIAEQMLEALIPFGTYSLRNLSYWAEALDKHPWLMRMYVDVMKPNWDFKDYTPEELAYNVQLQSQIINGQFKVAEFNNKILAFKVNPSIQDAITMFTQPLSTMSERLAAPIAAPIAAATNEYYDYTNTLPIIGPAIQQLKQTIQQKNPIPSVFKVMDTPRRTGQETANGKWSNAQLAKANEYRDQQQRVPRYRNNFVFDAYHTVGTKRYRSNMYPIIDIAHDIKMQYTVNVYNRIRSQVKTDVLKDLRYRIKLDANRFRK
jgi:hypothetical protein